MEDKFSYVVTFKGIKENEFNLNIPRYVNTFEEEAEVDIAAMQKEIDKLEKELATVQNEMKKYLKELGLWPFRDSPRIGFQKTLSTWKKKNPPSMCRELQ